MDWLQLRGLHIALMMMMEEYKSLKHVSLYQARRHIIPEDSNLYARIVSYI